MTPSTYHHNHKANILSVVFILVVSFTTTHGFYLISHLSSSLGTQQQPTRQQRQRRQRKAVVKVTTLNGSPTNIIATTKDDALPVERGGPKDKLMSALNDLRSNDSKNTKMGFGVSNEDRSMISKLAKDLAGYSLPLEVSSEWDLLYFDAPDVLGFRGGPLSQLVSIRQKIVGTAQLDIVLEYKPSDAMAALTNAFLNDVENDRLEQTVMFDYQKEPMNKINLKLKGTKIDASRFGSLPLLESPVTLPLGSFKVLFNDGDILVEQSIQGDFCFIYKRM
jgi:hypothetical protein